MFYNVQKKKTIKNLAFSEKTSVIFEKVVVLLKVFERC